jgi:hypothetical protein
MIVPPTQKVLPGLTMPVERRTIGFDRLSG